MKFQASACDLRVGTCEVSVQNFSPAMADSISVHIIIKTLQSFTSLLILKIEYIYIYIK